MISRCTLSLAIALLAFGFSVSAEAQSDDLHTSASYTFGKSIQLSAEVESGSTILRAAVFFHGGSSVSTIVKLAVLSHDDPAKATLILDPTEIGLGAFETLDYWWQLDLSSHRTLRSSDLEFHYNDDRFAWDTIGTDHVTLLYHDRDLTHAQAALEVAERAMEVVAQDYALFPSRMVTIVLYNNAPEMQAGLELAGPTWIGGNSRPESGIMLIAAAPNDEGLIDLERLIPHEMVHLFLEQRSNSGYPWVPSWLAEGMATMVEEIPLVAQRQSLETAIQRRELIPIIDLCASFPVSEDQARLAYAESASFVQYLLDVYGQGGLSQLLDAYREGASCEGAVLRVYQRSVDQLDAEWQHSIGVQSVLGHWAWLGYSASGVILLLAILFLFRIRNEKRRAKINPPSGENHA